MWEVRSLIFYYHQVPGVQYRNGSLKSNVRLKWVTRKISETVRLKWVFELSEFFRFLENSSNSIIFRNHFCVWQFLLTENKTDTENTARTTISFTAVEKITRRRRIFSNFRVLLRSKMYFCLSNHSKNLRLRRASATPKVFDLSEISTSLKIAKCSS